MESDDDQWEVAYLRATAFVPDLSVDDVVENALWEKVIGEKPKEEHINYQKGLREEKGSLDDDILSMASQRGRVDCALESTGGESARVPELPTIGSMSDATLKPFMEVIKKLLSACSPTNRLAFGAILVMRATDASAGYTKIQPYLHSIQMNPQETSDFFYQINRPRKSKICPDIRINRLSRWSMSLLGTLGVTVDPVESKATTSIQRRHACRLELDINTAVLNYTLTSDNAYAVFQELVTCGDEISSKGDVA